MSKIDMDAKEIAEDYLNATTPEMREALAKTKIGILAKAYLDLLEQNRWIPDRKNIDKEGK